MISQETEARVYVDSTPGSYVNILTFNRRSLDWAIEIMQAAGLQEHEILRLGELRKRVEAGQCDDITIEHKRFTFIKLLHEAGKIQL